MTLQPNCRDSLLSISWDLLWSTSPSNLKSICLQNTICRKWGGLGTLRLPKVISYITIRCSTYEFLSNFSRNYMHASILYRFRVMCVYVPKVANIHGHHVDCWHQKIRVPWLSCGVVCVILGLVVFTARRLAKRGICRRRRRVCVCVCVCVRHTPVLYQNG